jgi:tripartite-type tricarboxylate transporter receptor subunit TctC
MKLFKLGRSLLRYSVFGAMLCLPLAHTIAQPQAWPSKPVRLVVPFPAGGGADVVARLLTQKLSERWGQPVVVDNRAGANTVIGADAVAKSPADGYTLLMAMDTTLTQNQFLFTKLPYDPVADFIPISMMVSSPVAVIASEKFTGKNLQDWVNSAKAQPGKLNYGVSGMSTQITAALVEEATGMTANHIAYKGSAPTAQGLMAGDVDMVFDGIAPYLGFIKTGKAKVLAVTDAKRSGALPDVLTVAELGWSDVDLKVWFGMVAPEGTPADIVRKIHSDLVAVLAMQDVKDKLGAFAFDAVGSTPEQFTASIQADTKRYGPVIKRLGIKLD